MNLGEQPRTGFGFCTVQRAAEETGIPLYTLRRLIDQGLLRSVRITGFRKPLIFRADLERLVVTALDMQGT